MADPIILAPSGRPAAAELAVGRSVAMARATVNARDPYGTPNFDPNQVVTPRERRGSASLPGIYDEMLCYPVIARAVQAIEEMAIATQWRLAWPKGFITTPADDEFMTFAERCLITRPVVVDGLDVVGLENLIPYMLTPEWYGFGLFVPAFTCSDPADPECTVRWYPTRPSAITKWNPDFETGGFASALFATGLGSTQLTREQFVHFGRRLYPGEMEGVSRLRPLIVPFENTKQLLLDAGIYDTMRNGWLDVAYGPGSEGGADQARMVQGIAMVQAGATRAVLHKDTEKWTMQFPSGSPPDIVGRIELYERQMRELLDQSLGSVGDKGGSLALGTAAQQTDEARQARWIARAVNSAASAMLLWLARQVGAELRVMPTMEPVATESTAAPEQVTTFLSAVSAGVVRPVPDDQAWVRAALGAPEPVAVAEESADKAPQPLAAGSLQAAVTILTAPGLAPTTIRILLEGAGLDPAQAEQAAAAQAALAQTQPVAPPAATAPTAAPTAKPEPAAAQASADVGQGVTSGALLPADSGAPKPTAVDVGGTDYEVARLAGDIADAELAELGGDVPDYAVPADVQAACRAALDAWTALPAQRRSTDMAAVQVARDLAAGRRIRWARVLAMLAWMERDAVRAKRGGADLDADASKVAQAFRLRGGAAAVRWLRGLYRDHANAAHMRSARLAADEVDTTPTDGMVEEAERGLAWRKEHGRGGTEVGVARARDIANRKSLSPSTVKRMVSYFARHEVDKDGAGWSPGGDGYPSAGRIAWALWGGDAGKTWAEKVAGQLDRRADLAADTGADEDDYEVEGADGKPFAFYRPLRPEEQCVAWVTLAAERETADEAMTRAVNEVAAEHRKALWAASLDGWQPGEAEGIDAEFVPRYRKVVAEYVDRLGEAAANAAAQEALRAVKAAGGAGALPAMPASAATTAREAAASLGAAKAEAAELATGQAAQTMAQRVSGELANAIIGGATEETWESRITPDGLARDAKAAGTQAEAAARLDAYSDPPKPAGKKAPRIAPYAVTRTSIPDGARCRHCRESDTGKPLILADLEVSDGVYAIPELPDPECQGAPNCRCGYLVEYRQVEAA